MLLSLIVTVTKTLYVKPSFLPLFLVPGGFYLVTWISHPIPSSFAIILFFMLLLVLFTEEYRNPFMIGILGLTLFFFHSPSLVIILPCVIIFEIGDIVFSKAHRDHKINVIKSVFTKVFPEKRLRIVLFVGIGVLILVGVVFLLYFYEILSEFSGFLNSIEDAFGNEVGLGRYGVPPITAWEMETNGFLILIVTFWGGIYLMLKNSKLIIAGSRNLYKILFLFFIFFVTIPLYNKYWVQMTFIPYRFYRYFVYLDFTIWIIAPLGIYALFELVKSFFLHIPLGMKKLQDLLDRKNIKRLSALSIRSGLVFIIGAVIFFSNLYVLS